MTKKDIPDVALDKNNLITPRGYQALMNELNFLLKEERPRIVEEVRMAAKQGDRSENAEYQYGKKRLREIDRRTRFLSKRIEVARVIHPSSQNPDQIRFGATVTILHEAGETRTWQIVGEDETDTRAGRISWKSPVGRALLGKGVGDYVCVRAPKGEIEYEVVEFTYID